MKNILIAMIFACSFLSCAKDDDEVNDISDSGVITTITNGTWKVTQYIYRGNDETSKFSGYTFVFSPGNTVTATNGSFTEQGTWAAGTDDSKVKLLLSFQVVGDFAEISNDWRVILQNNAIIGLQHESSGDGDTDLLTFEKI